MKTNNSEIGRMEAPARDMSQAEAPILQHMENIRKYNDSDLPTNPPDHRGGRGGLTHGGGGVGLRSYIYIYIQYIRPFIFARVAIYVYIYIYIYPIHIAIQV